MMMSCTCFLNYSWPGNLREFRNVVRRAVLLTTGNKISAKTLPWEITNTNIFNKPTHEAADCSACIYSFCLS